MIVVVPMRVSSHKSLNYKKGIIRSRDLKGCSDEEIRESDGAKKQGIVDVKRFKIKNKVSCRDKTYLALCKKII